MKLVQLETTECKISKWRLNGFKKTSKVCTVWLYQIVNRSYIARKLFVEKLKIILIIISFEIVHS